MSIKSSFSLVVLVTSTVLLGGCAGSANHEVVTAYNASDD